MRSISGEHRFSARSPPSLRVDDETPPPLPPRLRASAEFAPFPKSFGERMGESFAVRKEKISESLAVGKERLGGGFIGKTAKLGKLKIWGAGQQMLDMTVAANLHMFLKAYKMSNLQDHETDASS